MSVGEDFYDALGVDRNASTEEIESAFRKQAARHHPDVSDDPDAEETFKKLQKAKEVLTDEDKRALYDRLGHDRFVEAEKHGATDGNAAGAAGAGVGDPFGGQGPFGDIGDIFEEVFGGGGRSRGPSRGTDLRATVEIDLEEAFEGTEKGLSFRRDDRCDDCDGTGHPPSADSRTCPECQGRGQVTDVRRTPFGQMQQRRSCRRCDGEGQLYSETCSTCGGGGTVRREVSVDVEIPPGIRDGQTVPVEGEGLPGDRGAPTGDLLVEVRVADHPEFDRDGDDLHRTEPVSFPQAVFGDEIEVPTIDGSVEMDLPAGTETGETFRLSGKGMPRLRGRGRGDLYVTVEVAVPSPSELTEEGRDALAAFAEAGGDEIEVDESFFDRLRRGL